VGPTCFFGDNFSCAWVPVINQNVRIELIQIRVLGRWAGFRKNPNGIIIIF